MSLGYGSSWSGDNNKAMQSLCFKASSILLWENKLINKSYISGGKGH